MDLLKSSKLKINSISMTAVDFFFVSEGIQMVFEYDSQNLLVYHPKYCVVAMEIIMAAKYPLKCVQSAKIHSHKHTHSRKKWKKKAFWNLSTVPLGWFFANVQMQNVSIIWNEFLLCFNGHDCSSTLIETEKCLNRLEIQYLHGIQKAPQISLG